MRFRSSSGSALQALDEPGTDPESKTSSPILELMKAVDEYIPRRPRVRSEKPFLMPVEGCVLDFKGRGTVGHRSHRAWHGPHVGDPRSTSSGSPRRSADHDRAPGVEMFRKLLGSRRGRRQRRRLLARRRRVRRFERGQVLVQAGFGQAAHQVHGRGLYPDEGRGWPSHAVSSPTTAHSSTSGRTDVTGTCGAASRAPKW